MSATGMLLYSGRGGGSVVRYPFYFTTAITCRERRPRRSAPRLVHTDRRDDGPYIDDINSYLSVQHKFFQKHIAKIFKM